MKKWMKVLLLLLLVLMVGSVLVFYYLSENLKELMNEPVSTINFEEIADGSYEGEYSSFPVNAKVNVTVINHEVAQIDIIEHGHGRGAEGEKITDLIIEQQSLGVDAITGATYSSMVIIQAIEDALINYD
jgi:uncharacterized protein with FMN-binding domain